MSILRASVALQASTVAEAQRLWNYMDTVQQEAGRVSYHHTPLRLRMKEQGVPWDPAVLDNVRWAAQAAAVALINRGLEEARVLAK